MRDPARLWLTVLLVPAVFSCAYLALPCRAAFAQANTLSTSASAPLVKDILINPPVELDNKTKQEIYSLRASCVFRHKDLVAGDYRPSEAVFGQITDKRPWWGIDGQFCRADGQHSIDGPSEESRFILNPFLLLALEENMAWNMQGSCTPAYPKPVSLQWFARNRKAMVTYALSDFHRQRRLDRFRPEAVEGAGFYLKNLNARDFGFEFVHVVSTYTENIRRTNNARMFTEAVQLRSFIHCGGSCGYPGGCNNGSPDEPDLHFSVDRLPATLYCKLWKSKPSGSSAEPDFVFIINLK